MIEIKDLLSRFNDLLLLGERGKEITRNTISEIIGVEINSGDIEVKNNTIYLNIKPIYKNEILIKREQINLKLEEILGKKAPQKIR